MQAKYNTIKGTVPQYSYSTVYNIKISKQASNWSSQKGRRNINNSGSTPRGHGCVSMMERRDTQMKRKGGKEMLEKLKDLEQKMMRDRVVRE